MVKVLIVAKTRMGGNAACVGGLTLDTNISIRLLRPDRPFQPGDSSFAIGHLCYLTFHRPTELIPPHMEDVIVTGQRYLGQQSNLRETLLQRIEPWQGGPERLYDGHLTCDSTSAYISQGSSTIPQRSTGFWLPNRPLILIHRRDNSPYYRVDYAVGNNVYKKILYIKYVGFAAPLREIPAATLVRVSLSRWWQPSGVDEERCYLQISGWYL